MDAYEQISSELKVCDKWTKYDWSLTAPHNPFLARIKNPLIVETDIFGEYFGQGYLPLMLKNHIIEKVKYCNSFGIKGYVSRIDRFGLEGNVSQIIKGKYIIFLKNLFVFEKNF